MQTVTVSVRFVCLLCCCIDQFIQGSSFTSTSNSELHMTMPEGVGNVGITVVVNGMSSSAFAFKYDCMYFIAFSAVIYT